MLRIKFLLGTVLLLLSCALFSEVYQPTFTPGYRPDPTTDEGGFWYQVDKLEEQVKLSPDLIRDEELNAYMKGMVCELAGEFCPHIRVYILRSPHFNASMYPNGMMHVWSGLLLRVSNEAELAAVLSHEIAHFLLSHQITQWRSLRRSSSVAIFADMFLTMGFASLAVIQNAMAFSREQETDADLYGLELMARAGYSPARAGELWEYIYQETNNDTSKQKRSVFFATHPKTESRMTRLAARAKLMLEADNSFKTNEAAYVEAFKPQYFEFMLDQLAVQDLGRTEALLERHEQIGIPMGMVTYFKGQMYKLRKQEGDEKLAQEAFITAIDLPHCPPEAHRELGYLLLRSNPTQAKYHLQHYLDLTESASDHEMVRFYLQSIPAEEEQ